MWRPANTELHGLHLTNQEQHLAVVHANCDKTPGELCASRMTERGCEARSMLSHEHLNQFSGVIRPSCQTCSPCCKVLRSACVAVEREVAVTERPWQDMLAVFT